MVMNRFKNKHPYLFINIILLSILIPIFITIILVQKGNLLFTDDIWHHVNRFYGIYEGVKNGQFPVYIYPNIMNGAGYGAPLFYSDFFIFPFAMLQFIGVPHYVCLYIYAFTCLVVSVNIFYCLSRKIFKNNNLALLATLLFATNKYFIIEYFRRFALGEFTAIIFLLILGIGIYNLLEENYSKPQLIWIALWGLTLSHIISLAFALIGLLIILLFNVRKIKKINGFIKKSLIGLSLYLLLTAFFTLPFFEMFCSDSFVVSGFSKKPQDFALGFDEIFTLFHMNQTLLLTTLVLALFKPQHEDKLLLKRYENNFKNLSIIILILFLLMTKLTPWKHLEKIFAFIQFPWRLNVIITPMLALTSSYLLYTRISHSFFRKTIILIFCCLSLIMIPSAILQPPLNTNEIINDSWIGTEWFPSDTNYTNYSDFIVDEFGNNITYNRKNNELQIKFNAKNSDYYIVPLVYYKGYTATTEDNNTNLKVEKHKNGIKVYTEGYTGEITVSYKGTTLQKVSLIVSFSTFTIISGLLIVKTIKKREA